MCIQFFCRDVHRKYVLMVSNLIKMVHERAVYNVNLILSEIMFILKDCLQWKQLPCNHRQCSVSSPESVILIASVDGINLNHGEDTA